MLEAETIITIATAAAGLIGSGTLFVMRMRAAGRENKQLKKQKEAEKALRIKEERDRFYLMTASNLVLSAERLNLTGAQKKEYVMTWLENEVIKAGIEVNKPAMSTSVERVVLIMNDHRNLDKEMVEILDADIEKMTAEEQARIEEETAKAFKEIERDKEKKAELVVDGVATITNSLSEVNELITKSSKRIG